MPKGEGNVVAQNKKARHDYSIVDTIAVSYTHLTLPTILRV